MRHTSSSHLRTLLLAAAVITSPIAVVAQSTATTPSPWELLVTGGKMIPTGAQRDAMRQGDHSTVQLAYFLNPAIAVTSSIGWTRSRNFAVASRPHLNVFMADVGSEARLPRWLMHEGVTLSPFGGAGLGLRNYSARSVAPTARYNAAAYVSVGSEIGTRRVRARLEARDYVTGFKSFDGIGSRNARNDVMLMAGLRFAKR